jgi:hypothetical protein
MSGFVSSTLGTSKSFARLISARQRAQKSHAGVRRKERQFWPTSCTSGKLGIPPVTSDPVCTGKIEQAKSSFSKMVAAASVVKVHHGPRAYVAGDE